LSLVADTSFVIAVLDRSDKYHVIARRYYEARREPIVFASVALTEVSYHLSEINEGKMLVPTLRALLRSGFTITELTIEDYTRALGILEKYHDTRIDFVDACIMALAERLQLKRILTFDHRDFGIFRPTHIERFELLP
jgi:uncharacterized protein